MADEGIPPWVRYMSDEMNRRFDGISSEIRQLVTRDAFRDEQSRVNDELKRLGREIGDVESDLKAESGARVAAEIASATAAEKTAKEQQSTQKATNWQWFLLLASPFLGALIQWIITGGLQK